MTTDTALKDEVDEDRRPDEMADGLSTPSKIQQARDMCGVGLLQLQRRSERARQQGEVLMQKASGSTTGKQRAVGAGALAGVLVLALLAVVTRRRRGRS